MSISPQAGNSFRGSDPTWRPDLDSPRPRLSSAVTVIAFVVLLGAVGYSVFEVRSTRSALDQMTKKLQTHEEQLAKLEGSVIRTSRQAEENISALRGEVSSTKGQITQATRQVESQVLTKAQQFAEQLTAEQKAAMAKVGGDVEQLKSTSETHASKLGSLTGEVGTVKSEVSSTREQLQKTIAELKSVRGDLGVQSGLIATNSSELSALKRLGERNYFEFDLRKTKEPQRVGGVALKLKNTDTKRNRYTVEVVADDKLTEKKDRTVNEPVQFYVAKARIPYEIVVNQIGKDRIVGYMATPKDQGR